MGQQKVKRDNVINAFIHHLIIFYIMTHPINTSFLCSPANAAGSSAFKGRRSHALNAFLIEVTSLDGDVERFEVEAHNFTEASELAERLSGCTSIDYINIYKHL